MRMEGFAAERANVGEVWMISSLCGVVHAPSGYVWLGVGPGGPFRSGGDAGGRVVSVRRKASMAASPPLLVRMCVGPFGDGANCTLHMVSSGGRFEALGLPMGRLVAVATCMRGVGTLASRPVIEVMTKPCACCVCASWRVQSFGSHWTRNSST